jgi:hypothetical protein
VILRALNIAGVVAAHLLASAPTGGRFVYPLEGVPRRQLAETLVRPILPSF